MSFLVENKPAVQAAGAAELFWTRIKHNKAMLRYKNFRSVAPAQFWRYKNNKHNKAILRYKNFRSVAPAQFWRDKNCS